MIPGYGAVTQALLGTLLTWGLTAVGAGCVFFIRGKHRKLLDVSLGFAAGVMTAASYWSLLEPAIEMCKTSGIYGEEGRYAFVPVAAGFLFGAVFVFGTDKFLDYLGINSTNMMITITKTKESKEKLEDLEMMTALNRRPSNPTSVVTLEQPAEFADCISNQHTAQRRRTHHHSHLSLKGGEGDGDERRDSMARALEARQSQWKRIMLLVVAITVHNIPEGLAVGVSFGAAASSAEASFFSARSASISYNSDHVRLETNSRRNKLDAFSLQQMKSMRRPYSVAGGYGPGGSVMPPPFAAPHQHQPPPSAQPNLTGLCRSSSPVLLGQSNFSSNFVITAPSAGIIPAGGSSSPGREGGDDCAGKALEGDVGEVPAPAIGDDSSPTAATMPSAAASTAPTAQANSKEKTPMCLVNELARYNKIKHQYRLTSETGPAHKKVFTVTLRLGDTEEYTAEGSSIKRAQHAAASAALSGTKFPPPPPRAPPAHAPHAAHHRHAGAVMPTVELNALAMKLCQPAVYTSVPPVAAAPRTRIRLPPPYRLPHAPHVPLVPPAYPRLMGTSLIYRVRVCVGGRAWLGEGGTPQAARHDAAARALQDLRPPPQSEPDTDNGGDVTNDILNSEVKSPVSLVHELALKRNQSVQFTVKSERGPPHMRVFVTVCTVGDMETEGEGNGKKVSKRRAAERMLDEMRLRWPPAMLRTRPTNDRRRHQPTKKKPRNLIKEGGFGSANGPSGGGGGAGGADNPISRLAVARHAARARSPQYRVLEERGAARRREFLVQCDAPPHSATGLGPNKKTAKRRAAHNVLLAMEMSASGTEGTTPKPANNDAANTNGSVDTNKTNNSNEMKRKESEAGAGGGGANGDVRQPVPGVLMIDYHQRTGQPQHNNNVLCETSATGGSGGNTPGAKDHLMYLSQLLGFTVQFSDFPKRNHGEYLSLVSLSTEPPVMCHGGGASTAHSHEQCARAALRALALMGLEPSESGMQSITAGPTSGVISNGITE